LRARAQSVDIARAEVGGRDGLVLTAAVVPEHAIGPREALRASTQRTPVDPAFFDACAA